MTIRDFNTPLSVLAKTSRHKICKDTENLKDIINQFDLTNIESTSCNNNRTHSFGVCTGDCPYFAEINVVEERETIK